MIAFSIEVDGFDSMVACADSMPKARFVVWQAAQEAGYKSVTFGRIKGRRAPQFDLWAGGQGRPVVVAEEFARSMSK